MENEENSVAENVVMIAAGIILTIVSLTYNGFVTMKLWQWFVAGRICDYELTYTAACGLTVLVSHFVVVYKSEDLTKSQKLSDSLVNAVIAPSIYLGLGWVVQSYL